MPFFPYDHEQIEKARELRRQMTPQECKLWFGFLRKYPVRFLRQKVIEKYLLDFYYSKARLCVELDGLQHLSVENREHDAIRSAKLADYGITTIRYSNEDIDLNFDAVCTRIEAKVKELLNKRKQLKP